VDLFSAVEARGNALEPGQLVFIESVAAPPMLFSAFPVDSIV
jgi:hypothetical protein